MKLCAISCDDVDSHVEWIKDICASQGCAELGFPILADPNREIITQLGMIGKPQRLGLLSRRAAPRRSALCGSGS